MLWMVNFKHAWFTFENKRYVDVILTSV